MQNQYQQSSQPQQQRSKDEVTIDSANAKKTNTNRNVGDYIDYEEIK
jgi:hypothetical protein